MKKLATLILLIFGCLFGLAQPMIYDPGGRLSERWQIADDSTKLFKVVPHRPVYFLLGNHTTDINNLPTSDNLNNVVTEPLGFSQTELKFQLSFKARATKNLFGKKIGGDLWVAFTQSSRWQLYNTEISRPFRETNYEPEFMLVFPTPYKILGLNGVFAGVGINHQSNGSSNPLSRSWNRIILQFGWESPNWSIVLSPWFRWQEAAIDDDNPGIENYIGRMELITAFSKGRHDLSLQARHSLRGGANNRGSLQVDYAWDIKGFLQIHAQVFHGYGESVIDYNHKQTTFGLGLSLLQWR